MAELIKRSDVINVLNENFLDSSLFEKDVYDGIKALPTTTEAEIRAKAQREIVEWCFDNKVDFAILERYANKEGVVDCVLKHFVAEQLKEE